MVILLEKVVTERIEPLLDRTLRETLGTEVPSLKEDITDRLKLSKGLVDTSIPFKKAKAQFKKFFLERLMNSFGSVTKASQIAGLERESMHRLMKQLDVKPTDNFSHYLKHDTVKHLIENAIQPYETVLHPTRVRDIYEKVPAITKEIVRELPEEFTTWKEAEEDFEKTFITQALKEHDGNISATARSIGLRFETVHRKIKELGLR